MSETGRIDLAHAPGFRLGRLEVRPGTRELVRDDGVVEVLEPRVMQVLVALARVKGAILSRDDLTQLCWEGRVVGEDAINRVISRLRRSAEGIGEGTFRVETITKVGYRLICEGGSASLAAGPAKDAARPPRRTVILGGAAAVTAFAGAGYWWTSSPSSLDPPDHVAPLVTAARDAIRQSTGESTVAARGILMRVTERAPDWPDGWGLLATVYASQLHSARTSDVAPLQARARAAIARAFALDADNVYARAAESFLLPNNRWLERERGIERELARRPDDDLLLQAYGRVMARVGRMEEAARTLERAATIAEASPLGSFDLMTWQWSAGRLDDADRTIERAMKLSPRNFMVWFGSFYIKLYTGRVDQAIALAEDEAGRPAGVAASEIERVLAIARIAKSPTREAVDALVAEQLIYARLGAGYAENAIRFALLFNRLDTAFEIANAYFLGRGFQVPEIRFPNGQGSHTRLSERRTWLLFEPIAAPMRADPRFAPLVAALGLERYWSLSGHQPDYRRVRT